MSEATRDPRSAKSTVASVGIINALVAAILSAVGAEPDPNTMALIMTITGAANLAAGKWIRDMQHTINQGKKSVNPFMVVLIDFFATLLG